MKFINTINTSKASYNSEIYHTTTNTSHNKENTIYNFKFPEASMYKSIFESSSPDVSWRNHSSGKGIVFSSIPSASTWLSSKVSTTVFFQNP